MPAVLVPAFSLSLEGEARWNEVNTAARRNPKGARRGPFIQADGNSLALLQRAYTRCAGIVARGT
jgi:hypothetical protein